MYKNQQTIFYKYTRMLPTVEHKIH